MPSSPLIKKLALLFCLFLSGAAALIFEVLWVRQLTLSLGHTTLAVSAVLAAFMAGLAWGSYLAGRYADNFSPRQLLMAYACIELGIGLTGWGSKTLIDMAGTLVPKIGVWNSASFYHNSIWFFLSFLILILPTLLMGATLPIITRWLALSSESKAPAVSLGAAYGANTLGAVMGTGLAGFYLIPSLGLIKTLITAGLFNLSSSALAMMFVFREGLGHENNQELFPQKIKGSQLDPWRTPTIKRVAIILFFTGAAAMICEVAWTRLLSLVIGSSTYAFTIMLLTFLLGLSIGAFLFKGVDNLLETNWESLSYVVILIGIGILAYLPFFNKLPYYFTRLFPLLSYGKLATHLVQFTLCSSVMILPTLLMGMLLPWAVSLVKTRESNVGMTIGFCYSANTLGGIAGSVLAGLVLIPYFSSENSLLISVWVYIIIGLSVLVLFSQRKRSKRILLGGAVFSFVLIAVLIRPPIDPRIISSGAFLYSPDLRRFKTFEDFRGDLYQNRLLFHTDGLASTVTVLETPWGGRFLRMNGKTDASSGFDMATQLLQGYLGLLLHSDQPRNALVIGLGSGVTAGALATDKNIERIDCVEIEPSLKNVLPFFAEINHNILNDSRARFFNADARHFLVATKTKYDIITSEPSNPWIAGVANLFTKEAFELTRARLAPDGIFCQWFHSYSMGFSDFKMVLNTFSSVFPHVLLFTSGDKDFFLIGSNDPIKINYQHVQFLISENSSMRSDLNVLGLAHPFTLIAATFLLDDEDFRQFVKESPLHTDKLPSLEFSAPYYLHRGEHQQILHHILASKQKLIPSNITGFEPSKERMGILYNMAGEAFMRLRQLPQAEEAFSKAMEIAPNSPRSWTNVGRIHNLRNEHLQAEKALRKAIALDSTYALAWFHLGMLYLDQGLATQGLYSLEQGIKRAPGDPMGSFQLGLLYLKNGRIGEARNLVREALSRPITNQELYHSLAHLLDSIEQSASGKSDSRI